MTNSLKPLNFGKGLIPLDEALAELEAYQPSEPSQPSPEPEPVQEASPLPIHTSNDIQGSYILMSQTDTYAGGVHNLREACQSENNQAHPKFTRTQGGIYRPLTFKENLQARVEDYESHPSDDDKRLRLFNMWLDSCCGVAYKSKSTKFKLVPICEELITIDQDFDDPSLAINYRRANGIKLDKNKGRYNTALTKQEVLDHPAWLAAVEGDRALLKTYSDIVFAEKDTDRAMWFWVLDKPDNDQLRALFVNMIGSNSSAYGGNNLRNNGSFLRVAP